MKKMKKAQLFAISIVMLPLLTHCKGEKNTVENDEVYPIPQCDAGFYYDGVLGACTANIAPITIGTFTSFRDLAFDTREANLESFITDYFTTQLPDYSLSTAPDCVEVVEYNPALNGGSSAGSHDISFECSFVLKDANGEVVLDYERQDLTVKTTVDSTAATPVAVPKYKKPVLKVLHDVDSDIVSLKSCTYSAVAAVVNEVEGKYAPEAERTTFDYYPTVVSCLDLGTRPTFPSALAGLDAKIIAFPFSFNTFLKGKRTNDFITGTTKVYTFADATLATVTEGAIDCDGTAYKLAFDFAPNPRSPAEGTLTVTNDDFFASVNILGADGFTYEKARSVLGCTSKECLEESEFSYRFFGTYVFIDNDTTGGRDVWKVDLASPTTLAFPAKDFEKPANAAICNFTYTSLGKL